MCRRKHRTTVGRVSVHAPVPPQESLECDGTRTKPSSNLDDARPVVLRFMGLLVESGSVVAPVALVTLILFTDFLLYSSDIYILCFFLLYFSVPL